MIARPLRTALLFACLAGPALAEQQALDPRAIALTLPAQIPWGPVTEPMATSRRSSSAIRPSRAFTP